MTQIIACDVPTFWRCVLDDETYSAKLYCEAWSFRTYRLLESVDTEFEARRRRYLVSPSTPAVVERIVDSSAGYIEEIVFDKRAKTARLTFELPPMLRGWLELDASLECHTIGHGRCERIYEASVSIHAPALGRMLEAQAYKEIERLQMKVGTFTEEYLQVMDQRVPSRSNP